MCKRFPVNFLHLNTPEYNANIYQTMIPPTKAMSTNCRSKRSIRFGHIRDKKGKGAEGDQKRRVPHRELHDLEQTRGATSHCEEPVNLQSAQFSASLLSCMAVATANTNTSENSIITNPSSNRCNIHYVHNEDGQLRQKFYHGTYKPQSTSVHLTIPTRRTNNQHTQSNKVIFSMQLIQL